MAGTSQSHGVRYTKEQFMMKEGGPWSSAWKIAAGVGAVGIALCAAGAMQSPEGSKRFAFSYLFAYFAILMIALGSAFFVIIQRLTVAHWSVTVRRIAEFFVSGLPVMAILALPVILNFGKLYPMLSGAHGEAHGAEGAHASAQVAPKDEGNMLIGVAHAADEAPAAAPAAEHATEHGAVPSIPGTLPAEHGAVAGAAEHTAHAEDPTHVLHEEMLSKKAGWFSKNFVYGRTAFYLIVWILLGTFFFNISVKQDTSRSPKDTLTAQKWAPVATMGFALSLTFAAFDWVMALEPAWFSTIFGVYCFSGAVVSSLAILILTIMGLQSAGYLEKVVNVEHFHDLGKLMFGFNCFWAYIAFSQYMLIWYAALPEETIFYHLRGAGPEAHGMWGPMGLLLIGGHFIFPFFWLISRHSKRTHLSRLKFGAAWLLAMHLVEWYWFVMPNITPKGVEFHFLDLGALLAVGGIYLAAVFYRMTKHPLIPVGDPRLERALHHFNA
jgi:hypothetical protein